METCPSGSEGGAKNPVANGIGTRLLPYGAEITIAATKVPAFKPGKQLKEEVNKGAAATEEVATEAAAKEETTK